jgi:hypothetical protein
MLLFDLFWGQSVLHILVEVVYISQISIIPNYRNFYKVGDTQFARPSLPFFKKILRWSFVFSRGFLQPLMQCFYPRRHSVSGCFPRKYMWSKSFSQRSSLTFLGWNCCRIHPPDCPGSPGQAYALAQICRGAGLSKLIMTSSDARICMSLGEFKGAGGGSKYLAVP